MQVEEIFIWGEKRKENRRISLLDDYYYWTTSSVPNQNAGFESGCFAANPISEIRNQKSVLSLRAF